MNPSGETAPQTVVQHGNMSPYELAKGFSDESRSAQEGPEDIYKVPSSNRPINHDNNQQILYRVGDKFSAL